MNGADSFAAEEIERAREYHTPLYVALFVDWGLQLAVLLAATFGTLDEWLWNATRGPWWAEVLELTVYVLGLTMLVRLPLLAWRSWARERRWSFSTQSFGGWLFDVTKGFVVGTTVLALGLLGIVWSARVFGVWWPAVAATGAALLTLALVLIGPLVFERLFNRFQPLQDEELAGDLRRLSVRAHVPVKTVLVSDATRRTRKYNAYVSGLGPTRRLVLFDTLLHGLPPREVQMVVAHELGHRRLRHVARGTVLAMAGAAASILVLRAVLGWDGLVAAAGFDWAADAHVVPLALLTFWFLEIAALPFETWLSRRWERQADRFALELTHDGAALEGMYRRLALANLADLDPPRLLYVLLFTHPTPPERIAAVRALNPVSDTHAKA